MRISNCLIIMFSGKRDINEEIKSCCKIINLKESSNEEKGVEIKMLIDNCKRKYSCNELFFDNTTENYLRNFSSEQIEKLIDLTCRKNGFTEKELIITKEYLEQIEKTSGVNAIGFKIRG